MLIDALRKGIRRLGVDLVRFTPDLARPFELVPVLLRDFVHSGEPVYIVQVGANDGSAFDPLTDSIRTHRIPALLVEPIPDLFERLRRTYEGLPDLIFENVAIAEDEGTRSFYRVAEGYSGPDHWQGLGSFDRGHLRRAGVPGRLIEELEVRTVPIGTLLDRHEIGGFTLLQVDTEGFDDHIVHSLLDTGRRPEIINFEHCHLPADRRHTLQRRLIDEGYRFLESWSDTTATRDEKRFPGLY